MIDQRDTTRGINLLLLHCPPMTNEGDSEEEKMNK